MLVICNGSFKSGSSWLHAIVIEILHVKGLEISDVPEGFGKFMSPTKIKESMFLDFVNKYQDRIKTKTYITKSHYYSVNTHKYNYPKDVVFLFITREIKDAVVSHYHHFCNERNINIDFKIYYLLIGRYKAYEIYRFNKICMKYHNRDFFFIYENLKKDFNKEVQRIVRSLGFNILSEYQLDIIRKNTNILEMRSAAKKGLTKYYPDKNGENWKQFRKGLVGDWKNYFSEKNVIDIQDMLDERNLWFRKFIFFIFFIIRRKLVK